MCTTVRSARRLLAALFFGAVGALWAPPVLAGAVARASASAPTCATAGLVVWLNTAGSGAAGSTYYNLELTNLSGHPCTLEGYPGVSAIGLDGDQLGSAASRNAGIKSYLVTLAEGASASLALQIVNVANYPAASCRPVMAAGLRVYPPNRRSAKVIPFPFAACSRNGPTYLSVQPA